MEIPSEKDMRKNTFHGFEFDFVIENMKGE